MGFSEKGRPLIPMNVLMDLTRITEEVNWGKRGVRDRENTLGRYDKWYEKVKKTVPKEKLLEFDVSMGWEPLCRFLGKEIPEGVAFPKETNHSTAQIKKVMRITEMIAWAVWVLLFSVLVGIGIYLYDAFL